MNAQNFQPNRRWTRRKRHQRRGQGPPASAGSSPQETDGRRNRAALREFSAPRPALKSLREWICCGDLLRAGARNKHDRRRHQRRNQQGQRLSEQMAQRQEIQNAKRQKRPGILSILRHFARDRLEIRQQIAVRDDDALRLGGGPRGEDDFRDIAGSSYAGRRWYGRQRIGRGASRSISARCQHLCDRLIRSRGCLIADQNQSSAAPSPRCVPISPPTIAGPPAPARFRPPGTPTAPRPNPADSPTTKRSRRLSPTRATKASPH